MSAPSDPIDASSDTRSSNPLVRVVEALGDRALGVAQGALSGIEDLGQALWIAGWGAANWFLRPFRIRLTMQQVAFIGVESLSIILLAATFTGAVFGLQLYRAFEELGAQGFVGGAVGVAVTKELGPTLTGLLVAGRAGSAMAAELGTMKVTEQVDALEAMAVDPVNYLVKPRLLAATASVPMLTAIFDLVAILGSYFVCVIMQGLSHPEFTVRLNEWVDWEDISGGLLKALVFGFIIGTVACYKGMYTSGGAKGVGRATTSAVVVASVSILVANFFIAWALP